MYEKELKAKCKEAKAGRTVDVDALPLKKKGKATFTWIQAGCSFAGKNNCYEDSWNTNKHKHCCGYGTSVGTETQ